MTSAVDMGRKATKTNKQTKPGCIVNATYIPAGRVSLHVEIF